MPGVTLVAHHDSPRARITAARARLRVSWTPLALVLGAGLACARPHETMLVNEPAYGTPARCPDSPAQFMQPGTDQLDNFSPDSSRCSYELPARAQVVAIRGVVTRAVGPATNTMDFGRGLEAATVTLFPESAPGEAPDPARAITRARTEPDGSFLLTARIVEEGPHLVEVRDAEGVLVLRRMLRLSPGQADIPPLNLQAPASRPQASR